MNSAEAPPTRVRTAIALSIAAHICAFALLALVLKNRPSMAPSALDAGPALIVTTVERRAPPPTRRSTPLATGTIVPHPTPRAARTELPMEAALSYGIVKASLVQAQAVPRSDRIWRPMALRLMRGPVHANTRGAPLRTSGPAHFLGLAASTPAPRATLAPEPNPTPKPTPTPTPTPRPAPVATSTPPAALAANFGGLFSQNYPPALSAPSDLAAIRSRLSGPVRIRIDVDETGHATEVRFVGPVSDPGLEQDIRLTLLALHYVPADCNGLHCDGTLEIAY